MGERSGSIPNIGAGGRQLPMLAPSPASRPPAVPPRIQKKTFAKAACEGCHSRKARCDARRPKCSGCVRAGQECIYPTIPSESRGQAIKRKYSELQSSRSAHQEIIEILQTSSEIKAQQLLQRLRAGVDPEIVLRHFRDGDLLLQLSLVPERRYRYEFPYLREMPDFLLKATHRSNPYLDTLLYDYKLKNDPDLPNQQLQADDLANEGRSTYWIPYHAAELVEPLVESIKPSSWTLVCSDDVLMRQLLRTFFLSEYQSLPVLHKDYFLEDMAAGRHDCCSPLLVHAVFAWACFCNRSIPNRAEFWNPANLGYRFLAEARRLWESEVENDKLTTIQAALILNIVSNMNGVDKLGLLYMTHAVSMAKNLGLYKRARVSMTKLQNSRDFTAWVLYAWQGLISYMFVIPPLLKDPPKAPLPDPIQHPEWYGEVRFRYPAVEVVFATHFGQFLKSKIELWRITLDIISRLTENEPSSSKLSVDQVLEIHAQLMNWYKTLPGFLQPERVVLPFQLQLHMQFWNYMINLFEEPMTSELEHPDCFPRVIQATQSTPREILSDSKIHLETIIRIYFLRHGFENLDALMVQYLSLLAFITNMAIKASRPDAPLESLRSTIVLAAMGLRAQAAHCYLGRAVFRVVRHGMGPEEIDLIDRFSGPKGDEMDPPKEWQMQSLWPIQFSSITDASADRGLGELMKKCRENELPEPNFPG